MIYLQFLVFDANTSGTIYQGILLPLLYLEYDIEKLTPFPHRANLRVTPRHSTSSNFTMSAFTASQNFAWTAICCLYLMGSLKLDIRDDAAC